MFTEKAAHGKVVCVGGAAIDRKYIARSPVTLGTSNPVDSQVCFGGVARNVAENLSRLGVSSSLVSVLGDDENGRAITSHLGELGVGTHSCEFARNGRTAEYVAVLEPGGDLVVGLADMAIFDAFTTDLLESRWPEIASGEWIFADCNLPQATLASLVRLAGEQRLSLAIDAVSTAKAKRLPQDLSGVGILFLNLDEARALVGEEENCTSSLEDASSVLLSRGACRVILTNGSDGLLVADSSISVRLGAAEVKVMDVTGAGDALIAGTLAAMIAGHSVTAAAQYGMMAARLTIEHPGSVRPDLSAALVETRLKHPFDESCHDASFNTPTR
ncbi:carbohydrate kinase family protein [Microvirga subterranea]|uniref:Pseudouridine kinase n=1 Tax=Microvirga subterranea TaxID=186651 RepID=A0A370H789_9HYPH|nr:carbohydrate kinase family protein [Microvirga subterranea]RDI52555.1 pseudouridine kinase [Microvirga subterranea]